MLAPFRYVDITGDIAVAGFGEGLRDISHRHLRSATSVKARNNYLLYLRYWWKIVEYFIITAKPSRFQ